MKHQFFRRAIALLLALVLAIPLMAAPAWAADGPTLSIKVNDSLTGPLIVGETIELEAVWSGGTAPADVEYSWQCKSFVASVQNVDASTTTATAEESGEATIEVTASWDERRESTTATYKLSVTDLSGIAIDGKKAEANATLAQEQEPTLTALWSNGEPSGDVTYLWTCSPSNAVTFFSANRSETKAAVGETATDTVNITVTATRGSVSVKAALSAQIIALGLAEPPIKVTGDAENGTLGIGKTATLTVNWLNGTEPGDAKYRWTCSDTEVVKLSDSGASATVTAIAEGTANITVTVAWGGKNETKTYTLTVKEISVTKITLNKNTLSLSKGMAETLTATVEPDDATDKTITWSSSDESVATVDENGKVTAVGAGTATITAKAGSKTATCVVTVQSPSLAFASGNNVWTSDDPARWEQTVIASETVEVKDIEWTVGYQLGESESGTFLPEYITSGNKLTFVNAGKTPGKFTITAKYKNEAGEVLAQASKDVTISGIILSGTRLEAPDYNYMWMYIGDIAALTVKLYGRADDFNVTKVIWYSSKSSVVGVNGGSLNAFSKGTAVITATKGSYSAECTVEVKEDTSVIAETDMSGKTFTATASEPLKLSAVWDRLNEITRTKTGEYGDSGKSYDLSYITNLKVSPNQGTLYYNFSTESDTGSGVGSNDRFAKEPSSTIYSIDKLFFVPAQGFTGTAEIEFNGVAANEMNFSGIIRVEVATGSGNRYQINYGARAGEPVWFLASDFSAFCRSVNGRDFNYIVFNLPKSSDGTLYYNYMAGSGNPVTTSIHFTPSGTYTIDSVCFVPNAALGNNSKVIISFRAVDTSGEAISGEITVNVSAANIGDDSSSVMIFGERDKPVPLQSELFNAACKGTLDDTLSFVTFKLPNPTEGTLYYNYRSDGTYDSRVTEGTRYYYSGVPGLNNVTFVPASGASSRIAISYTGYGSGGTSYAGTLYIGLDGEDSSTIRYSVEKSGSVTFNASDFYNAGLHQKGVGVDYVVFKLSDIVQVPDTGASLGTLYYNYRSSTSYSSVGSSSYYVSPSGGQRGLNLISFHAEGLTGTVTIPYEAVCGTGSNRQTFTGVVVIQVGAIAAADVNVSCSASGQVGLSSYSLDSVCSPVLGANLSYIEITSVPGAKEGHLYLNYYGFGTGTAVKAGDRFYRAGSPGIDQLSFVPYARFTGEAEITYIGYSADGQERVSGRVVVNVTKTGTSTFNDMVGYEWAIDSVEFLRRNGTVEGVGNGRYNPSGTITRADFALMLVRAHGFTAAGSAPFNDVPDGKYYADAVRIAYLRGIVKGYNGSFNPESPLTRQDAMVMIHNALSISGKTNTNGLAADLSAYHDEGQVATYAREIMGNLVQMGVIEGDGGYLRPLRELTRAEAAVLLHAIMTL